MRSTCLDELAHLPGLHDVETAVRPLEAAALSVEGPAENNLLRILGNLHKASGANQVAAEMRHVDVAGGIGLAHAEEGDVDSAPAVIVELFDRREDRVGIAGGAKEALVQHPAVVSSLLEAHPQLTGVALFGDDAEDSAGHAKTEIQRGPGAQFHCGAASDNAAFELRGNLRSECAQMSAA